jgi:hypothetical protein
MEPKLVDVKMLQKRLQERSDFAVVEQVQPADAFAG